MTRPHGGGVHYFSIVMAKGYVFNADPLDIPPVSKGYTMRRLQIILGFDPFREAWIEYPGNELNPREIDKTIVFLKYIRKFIAESLEPNDDDRIERLSAEPSPSRATSVHAD